MTWWMLILIAWAAMAVVMAGLWAVQRATRNAGIVDIAWSFGTGLCAVWFAWGASGDPARRWLVGVIAGVWGARLGLHLWRRISGESEDGRYVALREKWGDRTQRNLFVFFQVQAAWAMMFALPMFVAASNDVPGLRWHDYLGAGIWLIAMVGEGVADAQLHRFRSDRANKGRVCRAGLWRYTRHPNYFFEWVHWWAYVLIACAGPWWWLSLGGPAVMYLFLNKVTGIPPTEQRALQSRGEAYRQYQRTTNAFFPGPPREPTQEPST
jgi:steroid 5-alpha reductase family enzyme